jgi:PilZ domain
MTSTPAAATLRSSAPQARAGTDRRRHKRFAMTLLGRFMRESKHEYPCKLIDISVGGAAVMSPVTVNMGERIIAYFDNLGGIEGTASRLFEGGFAIKFTVTANKREKLAAQLTWLLNKDHVPGVEERRHERQLLVSKTTTVQLGPGITVECQVIDVSLSGASIATETRPAMGTDVLVGNLRARVMRHHDKGIGVQFLDIQDPDALRRHFS